MTRTRVIAERDIEDRGAAPLDSIQLEIELWETFNGASRNNRRDFVSFSRNRSAREEGIHVYLISETQTATKTLGEVNFPLIMFEFLLGGKFRPREYHASLPSMSLPPLHPNFFINTKKRLDIPFPYDYYYFLPFSSPMLSTRPSTSSRSKQDRDEKSIFKELPRNEKNFPISRITTKIATRLTTLQLQLKKEIKKHLDTVL